MKPRPSLRLRWFRTRALRAASPPSVLVLVAINLSAALLYLWASSAGAVSGVWWTGGRLAVVELPDWMGGLTGWM